MMPFLSLGIKHGGLLRDLNPLIIAITAAAGSFISAPCDNIW